MHHSFDISHAKAYGVIEAIFISNFQFWISKNRANGRHYYDGRTWTYNSIRAFGDLFPYLSPKQVRRAIDELVSRDVLVKGNYNERQIDQTTWYAFVDESLFIGAVSDLPKKATGDSHKGSPVAQKGKSTNRTDVNTDVTTYTSEFAQAWALYPSRPGANKKEAFKGWNARLKAGASPDVIIAGVARYAAYVQAMGTEPQYIKQPATFFGPGEHYLPDWQIPANRGSKPGKFDPTAYINQGAGHGAGYATGAADDNIIDIEAQFVECTPSIE